MALPEYVRRRIRKHSYPIGELYGYECECCGGNWKLYQTEHHDIGCPYKTPRK